MILLLLKKHAVAMECPTQKSVKVVIHIKFHVKEPDKLLLVDGLGKLVNKEILGHAIKCNKTNNYKKHNNNEFKTTNIYPINETDSAVQQYTKQNICNLELKKSNSKVSFISFRERRNSPKLIVLHHRNKRLPKHNNATLFHDNKVISKSNKSANAFKNKKMKRKSDCKEQRIKDNKLINNTLFLKHGNGMVGNKYYNGEKQFKSKLARKRYKDVNKTLSINLNSSCAKKKSMLHRHLRKVGNSKRKTDEILDSIKHLPIKFEKSQLFFMDPTHIAKMLQYCNSTTEGNRSSCKKREISSKRLNLIKNQKNTGAKVITNSKEKFQDIGSVRPLLYSNTDQKYGNLNTILHNKKLSNRKKSKSSENKRNVQTNSNKRMVAGSAKNRDLSNQRHKGTFNSVEDNNIINNLSYNSKLSTIYSESFAVGATEKESTIITLSNAIILKDGLSNPEQSHINKVSGVKHISRLILNSMDSKKISRVTRTTPSNNIKRKLKNDNSIKCPSKSIWIANEKYSKKYLNNKSPQQKDHLMVFYTNKESSSTSKDSLNIAIRRDTELSNCGNSNNFLNVVIKQTKNTKPNTKSSPLTTVKTKECENNRIESTILTSCTINSYENLENFECKDTNYYIQEVGCQTDFDIACDNRLNGISSSKELNYNPTHCYLEPDAKKSKVLNALETNDLSETNSLTIIKNELFKNNQRNFKPIEFNCNNINKTSKFKSTVFNDICQNKKRVANDNEELQFRVNSNSKLNTNNSSSCCYPDLKTLETKLKEIGLEKKEGFVRVIDSPRSSCLSVYGCPTVSNILCPSKSIDSIHGHLSNECKKSNNYNDIQSTTYDYLAHKGKICFKKINNHFKYLNSNKNKEDTIDGVESKFYKFLNSECKKIKSKKYNDLKIHKADRQSQKIKNSHDVNNYIKSNLEVCIDQKFKFLSNNLGNKNGLGNDYSEKTCNCIGALKNFVVSEIGVQTDNLLESYRNGNLNVQGFSPTNNHTLNGKKLPQVDLQESISEKNACSPKEEIYHQCHNTIEKKCSFVHIIEDDVKSRKNTQIRQKLPSFNGSKSRHQLCIDSDHDKNKIGENNKKINYFNVLNPESNGHQQTVNKINAIYEILLYLEKLLKDNAFKKINNSIENDNVLQFNNSLCCLCSDCLEILNKCEGYKIPQSNCIPMVIGRNKQSKCEMEVIKNTKQNKQNITLAENNLQFTVNEEGREPFCVVLPSKENLRKISDCQLNQTTFLSEIPSVPKCQTKESFNKKIGNNKYDINTYIPTKKINKVLGEKDDPFNDLSVKNNFCVNTERLYYNNFNFKDTFNKINCNIYQNEAGQFIKENVANSSTINNSKPATFFHLIHNEKVLLRKLSCEEEKITCGEVPLPDKSNHSEIYNTPFFHITDKNLQIKEGKILQHTSSESNTSCKKYLPLKNNHYLNCKNITNISTNPKNSNFSINSNEKLCPMKKFNEPYFKNKAFTICPQTKKLSNFYFSKRYSESSISFHSKNMQYANKANMKLSKDNKVFRSKSTLLLPKTSSIKNENDSNIIYHRDQNILCEAQLDSPKQRKGTEFNNYEIVDEHYVETANLSKPTKQMNYNKKENIKNRSPFTLREINSESSLSSFFSQCCDNSIVFVNQELQSTSQRHFNDKCKIQYFEKGNKENSCYNEEQMDQCFSAHKNGDWISWSKCNLPQFNKRVAIKHDVQGNEIENDNLGLQMNIKMNEIMHVKLFCHSPECITDI